MREIVEDILVNIDPNKPTVILHGCNCFNIMGAGIAKYLSLKFPIIAQEDAKTAYGSSDKLGTILPVKVLPNLTIVNCYTQFHYGKKHLAAIQPYANYEAIESCLKLVAEQFPNHQIRSPKIGCGLGRCDWKIVREIFEKVFEKLLGKFDVTIYYKPWSYLW